VAEVHKEVKMNMNQYEVMYVIDAALEDSARTELINRFSDLVTKNGGEVDRVDEWGKRRLAYAIQYKTEGYYVLMYIKAPAELPREIERNMQISDSVLRYLTVRYEGELPAKREPLKPYAPREAAPAAEAPAAAPVEAAAPAEVPAEAPVAEAVDDEKPESEAE
jgi:small subunit ribosomal protein S6